MKKVKNKQNSATPPQQGARLRQRLILLSLLFIGGLLRFYRLDYWSFRLDEAQSIWQASHQPPFIIEHQLTNVHLPLHNFLLRAWLLLGPINESRIRFLAAFFGFLCLPLLYFLTRTLFDSQLGLLSTFIAVFSPFWVWQSRENRMYSLLTFLVLLSALAFVKMLRRNRGPWWAIYTLANAIGLFTHYFYLFFLLFQALFFFLFSYSPLAAPSEEKKKTFPLTLFFSLALSALLSFLPLLPWAWAFVLNWGRNSKAPTLLLPSPYNLILSLFEFVFGFQPPLLNTIVLSLWPLLILLLFAFLQRRRPFSFWITFPLLGFLLPLILTYSLSRLWQPIYLTRYLSVAAPFFFITLAWFIRNFQSPRGRFLLSLLMGIGLGLSLFNQQLNPASPLRENYRALTSYLQQNLQIQDLIALTPPYIQYPFQYYYQDWGRWITVPYWERQQGAIPPLDSEHLRATDDKIRRSGHRRLWLITSEELPGSKKARQYFDQHYYPLQRQQFSAFLWLHLYEIPAP